MSDVAIKVQNLTKTFKIYNRAADRLKELLFLGTRKYHSDFTALKDLSFEIKKGDFLGVVGRNGAGKSTLLKILSRELTPSSGLVETQGMVSLLQLGVGFDPELTGAENARFASKLLGLSEEQIKAALVEIEKFADIGEFFHHPIKTYSSGMYSRLSFATAVNVNPDILIVDEVLSVGDMRFAQKCLRKMHEFKEAGKTVIFVTHSTQHLSVFCNKVMWIMDGQIFEYGDAKKVAENFKNYMTWGQLPNQSIESSVETIEHDGWENTDKYPQIGGEKIRIDRVRLVDENGNPRRQFKAGEILEVQIEIRALENIDQPIYGFVIYDENGLIAIHTNSDYGKIHVKSLKAQEKTLIKHRFRLPALNSAHYVFGISVGDMILLLDHRIHDILYFEVKNTLAGVRAGYLLVSDEGAQEVR